MSVNFHRNNNFSVRFVTVSLKRLPTPCKDLTVFLKVELMEKDILFAHCNLISLSNKVTISNFVHDITCMSDGLVVTEAF